MTELKRCVYCGGDAHPAECGTPDIDYGPHPLTRFVRWLLHSIT